MKLFLLIPILFLSSLGNAEPGPNIPFRAECVTTPGQLITHVTIDSEFIWASYGTDLGPTTIHATREASQNTILNLHSEEQTFFRETELGMLFFGTYKNANLTAPNQTVHVLLAYQSIMSVLQELALANEDPKFKAPQDRSFVLSAFAEEDKNSNILLQLNCNFSLKK